MKRARVIPVLLLKNKGLYKTIRFKNERYVGDPINAVKIFNEKLCDELIFLDISVSKEKREIDYKFIEEIASECFMPFSYGGGINTLYQIEKLLKLGIEKVILNTVLFQNFHFLTEASENFGNSTIVASVDVTISALREYQLFSHTRCNVKGMQLLPFVKRIEDAGAGEIMINYVNHDGMMNGYDQQLAKKISNVMTIPVVYSGGCKNFEDIKSLLTTTQISAAAVGSLFVFQGPHRGVLISYPSPGDIESIYS